MFYTPNRKFLGIYENPYLEYFEEHSIRNDDFNTKDEKTKFKFKVGHDDRWIRRKFDKAWKVEWPLSNYLCFQADLKCGVMWNVVHMRNVGWIASGEEEENVSMWPQK